MLTAYHAKYFAHELTKRCPSDSIEKLASALVDARVDLNPHQIEAALFAFRSPLSKGALLADEVGLGKTIEAGPVLSQKSAEPSAAFSSSRLQISASSGIRNSKKSFSCPAAFWKRSLIAIRRLRQKASSQQIFNVRWTGAGSRSWSKVIEKALRGDIQQKELQLTYRELAWNTPFGV